MQPQPICRRGRGHNKINRIHGPRWHIIPTLEWPVAIGALTDILNQTIVHNNITNTLKMGKIIPILKPNKNPTEPSSYRTISLLCYPIIILERLIFNTITQRIPLSPTQHGFRALHSATTLLTTLTQYIHEGLNFPKPAYRTLLATIDISKAFVYVLC